MSPTQRSLKYLRDLGFTAAVVERWNPHVGIRQDLFGWMDILAYHPLAGTIGVQTTSGTGGNFAERIHKVEKSSHAATWHNPELQRKVIVHGWAKRQRKGERVSYELRQVEINLFSPEEDHD